MVCWKSYVLIYLPRFLTLACYDYKITTSTLTFEPSFEIRSQQQCLEIEIINDSLPEDREVLTLQLSTNNPEVQLITHRVDVYIIANDGKHHSNNYVNTSSLQLVEMCNSEGVWSPVCDNNWTLQDATVVCRELNDQGYQP